MDKEKSYKDESANFSIVVGGPLYEFYRLTSLVKPPLYLYKRRIIVITLFTWLPLLLLSLASGTAFHGPNLPFIFDIETHARFLGALTLFILGEVIIHKQFKVLVGQFTVRAIIAPENLDRFNQIIESTIRMRNSVIVELSILILVFTIGQWITKDFLALHISTWYILPVAGQMRLTLPGYWYSFVSVPVFQFLLLRWYYRLFIWYRFLWQVSRTPLHLNSLHPDKMGGLGFLTNEIYGLEPLLMAHSVLIAGFIINRIWNAGAVLTDFKLEIVSFAFFLTLLALTPLFFFILPMAKAKRMGTIKYGAVATKYVNYFRSKWINGQSKHDDALLGSSDIQSLADLYNSFQVTNDMQILPFRFRNIIQLLIIIALPLLPLMLTLFNIEDILKLMFKTLF